MKISAISQPIPKTGFSSPHTPRYNNRTNVTPSLFSIGKNLLAILLIATSRLNSSVSAAVDLESNLMVHLPLDGTAEDISGNERHGIVSGAVPCSDIYGYQTGALCFDGKNDFVELSNSDGFLSIVGPWTISALVQSEYSTTTYGAIVYKTGFYGDREDDNYGLYKSYNKFVSYMERRDERDYFCVSENYFDYGSFYHLAAAYDGTYLSLTIDGQEVCTNNIGYVVPPTGTEPLRLGSILTPSGSIRGAFKGSIDEVRLYRRWLNLEERQALFELDTASFPTLPPVEVPYLEKNLLAYYPLDGTALDASGKEHPGTILGAVPTTGIFGEQNGALYFDGVNDVVEVPNTDRYFDIIGPWTVSALILSDDSRAHLPIVYKTGFYGDREDDNYGLYKEYNRFVAYMERRDEHDYFCKSDNYFEYNKFYHLVASYDGTYLSLSVDGAEVCSSNIGYVIPPIGTEPLRIGSTLNVKGGVRGALRGKISQVRLYNRALSSSEKVMLYLHDTTPSPTEFPTFFPTDNPTLSPTMGPTYLPTWAPSQIPTRKPTSSRPTFDPTRMPTAPTYSPSRKPSPSPSFRPTGKPSHAPSLSPTQEKFPPELKDGASLHSNSRAGESLNIDISKLVFDKNTADKLTFNLVDHNDGSLPNWISLNKNTGLLTGTVPKKSQGTYVLPVEISDGELGTVISYSVTVKNQVPVLRNHLDLVTLSTGNSQIIIDKEATFEDPDGDLDTLTLAGRMEDPDKHPDIDLQFYPSTNKFIIEANQPETFNLVVEAKDNYNATLSEVFPVKIEENNKKTSGTDSSSDNSSDMDINWEMWGAIAGGVSVVIAVVAIIIRCYLISHRENNQQYANVPSAKINPDSSMVPLAVVLTDIMPDDKVASAPSESQ